MSYGLIKNDKEHEEALAELASLWNKVNDKESNDFERFDELATLIDLYEEKHQPILAPSPGFKFYLVRGFALGNIVGAPPMAAFMFYQHCIVIGAIFMACAVLGCLVYFNKQ